MLAIWTLVPLSFGKTSLNIRKFPVHILLKPGLEIFEHYFTSMWDECNCVVVWGFFGIAFLRDWNENWPFQSCGHRWVLQICWHIECSTFTASPFRIWNSSTGIPEPPLALFVWCFLRPIWLHTPRCLALGEWSHHHGYLGCEDLFLYSSMYSYHCFLLSFTSVRSILFLFLIVPIFAWNVPLVSLIFLKGSLVFPFYCFPLFLCIVHLGRLFYLSLIFFRTLHSDGYIFPFLLCLLLLF